MKTLQLLSVIFCLSILSSCDVLKEVANTEMDKRLTCIPATSITFHNSYRIVSDKRHEHDKIKSAKQETERLKCMSTKQIRQVTELLRHEHDRLNYAKHAYSHCSNPESYYVNMKSLLRHEHSKNELEKYTRNH